MPFSYTEATGTGSPQNLSVPPYLLQSHITVFVDGVPTTAFQWLNSNTISITAPANRLVRVVRRTSPEALLTQFPDGQSLPGDTLELDSKQAFYLAQEAYDMAVLGGGDTGGTPTPGTVQTIEGLLALLTNQLTLSQFAAGLRNVVGLIDAPSTTPNSPAWHAAQEALSRAAALAAEVSARQAAIQAEASNRAAAVASEAAARVSGDEALASQITLVNAKADGNTAAIQATNIAVASGDTALAAQITALDAAYKAADATLQGSINTVSAAQASGDAAIATRIDTLKAAVNPGVISDDPDFRAVGEFWQRGAASVVAGSMAGRNALRATAQVLVNSAETYAIDPTRQYRVTARVRRDAAASTLRRIYVGVDVRDAAGASIAGDGAFWFYGAASDVTPGTNWATYTATFGAGTGRPFPVAGVRMRPVAYLMYDSGGAPAGGWHELEDFRITDVETERLGTRVGAVETSASTSATRLNGVEANYSIKVAARSDGKTAVAGIGLLATSNGSTTQSEVILTADKFVLVPSLSDVNATPVPVMVAGLVNGANTLVVPSSRLGDQTVGANVLVDGAITTRKLSVIGGGGTLLNPDPNTQDASAWTGGTFNTVLDPASPTGWTLEVSSQGATTLNVGYLPLDASKAYQISTWARNVSGSAVCYLTVAFYDGNQNVISGGASGWLSQGTFHYYGIAGTVPPSTWTEYKLAFGSGEAASIPAGAKFVRVGVWANFNAPGVQRFTGIRLERKTGADLLVNGLLQADNVLTRGLTVRDSSGNVVLTGGVPVDWSRLGSAVQNLQGLGVNSHMDFVNLGNMEIVGDTARRVGGTNGAWNGAIRSRSGLAGPCEARLASSGATNDAWFFGLSRNPDGLPGPLAYENVDFAFHRFGSTVFIYESGNSIWSGAHTDGNVYSIRYDGSSVRYWVNGLQIRVVPLALGHSDTLFFKLCQYYLGNVATGMQFRPLGVTRTDGNLLRPSTWRDGTAGNPPGFEAASAGPGGSNAIGISTTPDGSSAPVWTSIAGTDGQSSGGFFTENFSVDERKLYRFSVWVRYVSSVAGGYVYLGPSQSVATIPSGATETNPYFVIPPKNGVELLPGEWTLLVGYVFPSTYSGPQLSRSGAYRASSGARITSAGGTDFKWLPGTTVGRMRTFQYYVPSGGRTDFYMPRVDVMDGSELPLDALLAMGVPSARNPITPANASTFIASAAINLAQINTATIGSLAALSAEMGSVAVSTTGHVRSGQGAWNTGSGWWLGHTGGEPALSIGNPAGSYMTYKPSTGLNLKLDLFTASHSGNISVTGSTNTAPQQLGFRSVTTSGGSPPFTYEWTFQYYAPPVGASVWINGGSAESGVSLWGDLDSTAGGCSGTLSCRVTDANGRVAATSLIVSFSGNSYNP